MHVALFTFWLDASFQTFKLHPTRMWKVPRAYSCFKMNQLVHVVYILTVLSSEPLVNNLVLSPVIDGDFLPTDPLKLFQNAADIDFIAGVNDMDGHNTTATDIPSVNSVQQDTPVWVNLFVVANMWSFQHFWHFVTLNFAFLNVVWMWKGSWLLTPRKGAQL